MGILLCRYARSRHADSDIGRNSRQQQVLLALRQQGLNLNIVTHLNDILTQLNGAVKTDLSITQVGSLAQLAKQIDRNSIQTIQIGNDDVVRRSLPPDGADVLMPQWNIIRPKVQKAFSNDKLVREAAHLSVLNGTTTNGVARTLSDTLAKQGYTIANLASATDQGSYPKTVITDYTGGQKPYTIQALTKALGLDASDVKQGDPNKVPNGQDGKPIDIQIIAGDDRLPK